MSKNLALKKATIQLSSFAAVVIQLHIDDIVE